MKSTNAYPPSFTKKWKPRSSVVERMTNNREDGGSNPSGATSKKRLWKSGQ